MNIRQTVSFSGYRPEKLPDGGDENTNSIQQLKNELYNVVMESIDLGFNTFLTGMAEGFDMFAAEEVINIKDADTNVNLIAVIPFRNGYYSRIEKRSKGRYTTYNDRSLII